MTSFAQRRAGAKAQKISASIDKAHFMEKLNDEIYGGLNMKKYNAAEIMTNAWNIYRSNLTGDGLKPIFGICLKMAWENALNTPDNVLQAWNALTPAAQMSWLQAAVKRASKDEIAYSVADKYNPYHETVAWFLRNHGLDELTAEAWVKLNACLQPEYLERRNARRLAAGKTRVSLSSLVYGAAIHGINKVYREDIKHVRARVQTITDESGTEYSYIDTMATNRRDNTELQAVNRVAMEDFLNGRDHIDRLIIEGIRSGYKGCEIAKAVGVSAAAITKRLNKIRAALGAEMRAEAI